MIFSLPFHELDVERFSRGVMVDPVTGCHRYTGSRFHVQNTTLRPAGFAWMNKVAQAIPRGYKIYTTCATADCVNPDHLICEPDRRNSFAGLEARFKRLVDRRGECHIYDGTIESTGYGVIGWRGRNYKSHHVAWRLAHGDWPKVIRGQIMVCHKCHNRRCVNPTHLRIDTVQENTNDRVSSGRGAKGATHGSRTKPESVGRGEDNGRAKLTEQDAVCIRRTDEKYTGEDGLLSSLERHFKVTSKTLKDIISRKLWRDVPEDAYPEITALPRELVYSMRKRGGDAPQARFTDGQRQEMRWLHRQAKGRKGTLQRIQARYGVSSSQLRRILREASDDLPDGASQNLEPLFPQ